MKLLSSITLALIGLSYGQVDYSDYSTDYSYELDQLDSVLADLEANPTVEPFEPVIGARARGGGSGRGTPGATPAINLPPALQAFTLPSSAAGSRKLPPGIDLADFIGPNGFQTQRFLKALQAALRRQAEEQRRRQQAAREAAAAEAARQAAAEKAAAEQAAAEAAAKKAAEEEAARKAAAIEAANLAAAEAARKAAEEAERLEAARLAAEEAERQLAAAQAAEAARLAAEQAAEAERQRLAAEQAAEAERQRLAEEQAMMEAMQAESMMFGGFDSNAFGNMDGMVASSSGRPSGGRPSSGAASAGTRDFIGTNANDVGDPTTQEVFNSCRVCTKMTAAECAQQPLVTCYEDKSKEGVFLFNEPNMTQDDRVCMLQTEQRKLTNGQIKTLFTSRCVTPMACESQVRQNFLTTEVEGLMKYNRCKQTGMLKKNGNINKSECAFCNKMSHESEVVNGSPQRDNQWFPVDINGDRQDCSLDEDNCVVFRYKVSGVYTDMTMSALFPSSVTVGDPDAFKPHLLAKWEEEKRLGQLVFDAAYIVPEP